MKIVNLSIQTTDAKVMIAPADDLRIKEGYDIDLYCVNEFEADEDVLIYQELVRRTEKADLTIIRCMSDPTRFKRFEKYEEVLKKCSGYVLLHCGNPDVTLLYRSLFKGSDEDYVKLLGYLSARGMENEYGIIYWLNNVTGGKTVPLPEPVIQRTDGIYHKGFDRNVETEDYLKTLDPDKPTAGIMFTSNLWIYNNLEHIDALVERIEREGMNTIPFFFATTSSSVSSTKTVDFVERYFMKDGNPLVDVILMCSPFSQLFNSREPSEGLRTRDEDNFFKMLTDVPVFQVMTSNGKYYDYEDTAEGLNKNEIQNQVAYPEIDGQIITVPIGAIDKTIASVKHARPIEDRIDHIARLAKNWAKLRRTPVNERKIAILLYQSRPDSGRIGSAAGLDSIESVYRLLIRMREEGYDVGELPENSKGLVQEFLDGVTNDLSWTSPEEVRKKAVALVDKKDYLAYYERIPDYNKKRMEKNWGPPPGTISVDGGKLVIPGILKGNVFIGYQPLRAMSEQTESLYHSPDVVMPHQYLEYYRWLQYDFKAGAVVHVGTHGTLEWLPGKTVGLSGKCFPDLVLDALPNIYPYVIDDPGEGIQAKRRSEAVLIGHLNPTMARAGGYDDLSAVEVPMQDYFKLSGTSKGERRSALVEAVYEAAKECKIFEDLGIEDCGPEEFEKHIGKLHDYISELKDAIIRNGLHVLGKAPEDGHLDEAVYSLTKLKNGDVPSFRDSFASMRGVDILRAVENPSELNENGKLNSEIVDITEDEFSEFLEMIRGLGYDKNECLALSKKLYGKITKEFEESLSYVCDTLVPNLIRTSDEIEYTIDAFEGRFVLPGPSGAPTRGNADILPMGRNYYGIDPGTVPSRASWIVGCKMADQMIERYIGEKGTYPKEVGFIIWATDTMKTGGDDVAYILWLMGVRPVWSRAGGQVIDLEVIPLEELKRPRIDVTVRITGLFRDTFPNIIDMIDDAVQLVSSLDESDEENYLASNLRKDIIEKIESGMAVDEARRSSSVRVFGCPPGMYGPGVNHAIESGNWKTVEDLADIYITWGSYGYARDMHGKSMRDDFVKRFGKVGVTVKNMPDREIDLLDIDDVYSYLGGLNAFVRAYGNKDAISVMGDGSNPENTKIRDTQGELRFVFRSKILNPKFLSGLKEHGYRGVSEIANMTEYLLGWDATSDIADDWMYSGILEKFLEDEDTREWMKDENPFAMMSILERLQEAIERGLWEATEDEKKRLEKLFMEAEERIEEVTDR